MKNTTDTNNLSTTNTQSTMYSFDLQKAILALKNKKLGSRAIAAELNSSKSGVNAFYSRYMKTQVQESLKRYCFIDIETLPDIAVTFKRFKANLGQDNILKDGGTIVSISWRWMGDKTAQGMALTPQEAIDGDDSRLCAVLYSLIEQSDVLLGHNIDNFDLPMIKSRLLINKFQPPKKIKTIDTLKIARQMRFPSNRLGSLGVILGEGDKASHSGINTWIGCMAGNQDSLDEMLAYNLEDVDLLYRVYMRLRAFDTRPLNSALFIQDETPRCPVCGSEDVHETLNSVFTPTCEYQEVECGSCGSRSRGKVVLSTKTKRKSLLAN